jgi:hypothetical protein
MWGGDDVVTEDNIKRFPRQQDLLGLSTYLGYDFFKLNNHDLKSKSYHKDVEFIEEKGKLWKKIKVEDDVLKKYFNWEKTHSVKYSGYLLNHTKKLAVDIADYCEQSKGLSESGEEVVIDLVPVLTETGGGTEMALLKGTSIETTEKLAGTWCGDLLQIVDELPKKYKVISCCFAEIWHRIRYCYITFGTDKDDYILKNNAGERYNCINYNCFGQCSSARHVRVNKVDNKIQFCAEVIDASQGGLQ